MIPLQLEHDPNIFVLYIEPKYIEDFLFENEWLGITMI